LSLSYVPISPFVASLVERGLNNAQSKSTPKATLKTAPAAVAIPKAVKVFPQPILDAKEYYRLRDITLGDRVILKDCAEVAVRYFHSLLHSPPGFMNRVVSALSDNLFNERILCEFLNCF
jgi:hypothetical protein